MRARALIAIACWAGLAATAAAIPYIPPPQPVYEAPIDRALENVATMEGVEEAQRERLLGRLNLLAYARADADFTYLVDGDQFNEAGSVPCAEAPRGRNREAPKPEAFGPDDRCARINYTIGPRGELPGEAPAAASDIAAARLEAAERHYARAIELEGANLRARLGYAYVLDRLGRISEARGELRTILHLGLPQLAGPQSEWEAHAVLTEAAAHLGHLAASRRDRAKMARLQNRLQASRPMIYVTPIVAPLTDAPFARLIDNASPVAFDFAGTGDARAC